MLEKKAAKILITVVFASHETLMTKIHKKYVLNWILNSYSFIIWTSLKTKVNTTSFKIYAIYIPNQTGLLLRATFVVEQTKGCYNFVF